MTTDQYDTARRELLHKLQDILDWKSPMVHDSFNESREQRPTMNCCLTVKILTLARPKQSLESLRDYKEKISACFYQNNPWKPMYVRIKKETCASQVSERGKIYPLVKIMSIMMSMIVCNWYPSPKTTWNYSQPFGFWYSALFHSKWLSLVVIVFSVGLGMCHCLGKLGLEHEILNALLC